MTRDPRKQEEPTRIAAVILAAGQSSRMGKQNKLLATVGGDPMLRHVVVAALNSNAQQVIVVTGHENEQVQQALTGLNVETVFNPDYTTGMASSLVCGLNTISEDIDGAMILLGDMPLISAVQLNEIIAEFDPDSERDIVVPVKDGRRGNPVLWGKRYFPEIKQLTGDTGARGLLKQHAGNIRELAFSNDAIFVDFDTPEALATLKK